MVAVLVCKYFSFPLYLLSLLHICDMRNTRYAMSSVFQLISKWCKCILTSIVLQNFDKSCVILSSG